LDEPGELTTIFDVKYVDTTYVISPKGKIILRSGGPVNPSLLRQALYNASARPIYQEERGCC